MPLTPNAVEPITPPGTVGNIVSVGAGDTLADSGKSFSTDGTFAANSDALIPTQKAVKTYADMIAAGFTFEPACYAGSTANLNATYSNGVAGVGATLTNAGALAAFSIDGVTPPLNSRILVKDQSSTFQNGIYTITTVGSGAVAWILTRATDYDTPAEITPGGLVPVTNGTSNLNSLWLQNATVTTIGTDPITFQVFVNPSNVAITGGTINGTTIGATTPSTGAFTRVDVDNIRIDGNTISSTDSNGDINLTPNGTGRTVVPNWFKVGSETARNFKVDINLPTGSASNWIGISANVGEQLPTYTQAGLLLFGTNRSNGGYESNIVWAAHGAEGADDAPLKIEAQLADLSITANLFIFNKDGDFAALGKISAPEIQGGAAVTAVTDGVGSPYAITTSESGTHYTNTGATAEAYLELPAATVGLSYNGACTDSDLMRFVADGTDTIRDGSTVSGAGGYCQLGAVGSCARLVCYESGKWTITAGNGTLNVV